MDRQSIKRLVGSINREERRKSERLVNISKRLKQGCFYTGNKRRNIILNKDQDYLYVKAEHGKRRVKVPIKKVKEMVAYFYRIRITERKELEVFHRYNSLMFGLLSELFRDHSKIFRKRSLLRIQMTGIRIFLAGGERSKTDLRLAYEGGGRYILYTYFRIRDANAWKNYLIENGYRGILDCGKFSEWMAQKSGKQIKPIEIDDYIEFIKANLDLFDAYFVLDEIENPEKTRANLRYMEEKGLSPIPVFHMGKDYASTDFAELDRLVKEGYPVLGIGGTVKKQKDEVDLFLNEVFRRHPTQAFHGLGITKAELLFKYPFFSCDSTAWIYGRRDHRVLTPLGQRKMYHIPWQQCLKKSVAFLASLEKHSVYRRILAGGGRGLLKLKLVV